MDETTQDGRGDLISAEYREAQRQLHENPDYGVASVSFAPIVGSVINQVGVTHILDYGCGKARLMQELPKHLDRGVKVQCYDPAVERFSAEPTPAEMVCCIDVLEHIEPHLLDNVLDHLADLTQQFAFLSVHTGPARKTLPDGRNAHLIQEDERWWLPKLMQRWELLTFNKGQHGFWIVGRTRNG